MFERFRVADSGDILRPKHAMAFVRIVGVALLLAQLSSLFSLIFPACWLAQPFGSVWDAVNEAGIRVSTGGIVLVTGAAYVADFRVRTWFARIMTRRPFRMAVAVAPGAALPLVALLRSPVLAAFYLTLLMAAFLPSALMLVRWMRELAPGGRCGAGCLALVCTSALALAPTGAIPWLVLGMAVAFMLCLRFDSDDAFKFVASRALRKKARCAGAAWPGVIAAFLLFGMLLVFCSGVRDAATKSYGTWLPLRRDDYLSLWSLAVAFMLVSLNLARPGGGGLRSRLMAAAPTLLLVVLVAAVRGVLPAALSVLVPSLFVPVVLAVIELLRDRAMPSGAARDAFVGVCTLGAATGKAGSALPAWLLISQSDGAMPAFMLFIGATLIVMMALLWGERIARQLVCRRQVTHITASADLSSRERTVIAGMLAGESLGSLADRLGISRATVSTYAKRAYRKLGVRDHAGLLALAQKRPASRHQMNVRGFAVGWRSTAFPLGVAGAYLCGLGLYEIFAYDLLKPHILAWIAGFPVLRLLVTPGAAACALAVFGALVCSRGLRGAQWLFGGLLTALVVCGVVGWMAGEPFFDWLLVHAESGQRRLLGGALLIVGCMLVFLQVVRDGAAARLIYGDEDEARAALVSMAGLSASEAAVALMLAFGMRPAGIAERLVISPRTVETHRKRIYAKLGIHGQDEVASALWSRLR